MKKSTLFLSLLTMLVAGCSQDNLIENQSNQVADKVFTATLEEDTDSRIYVGADNSLLWTAGDQISIFAGSTVNSPYQFAGSTGDATATFSAVESTSSETGSSLDKNYAVYPYSSTTRITTEGVITITLPATQNYVANSFGLAANTMVAVTADVDDNQLNFKNACGYLKFQLYGTDVTVKSITLTGKNNEKLAGTATITPNANKVPVVAMSNDATSSITLDCGNGITIGTTKEKATAFWMVVPSVTFNNGFTITVETTDGVTFTQSTSKLCTVSRNKIKPMAAFEVKLGTGTLLLPTGRTYNNTVKSFLNKNANLTKIKFVANSSTTSDNILVTDEDGTKAYMVANTDDNCLEIHTLGRKFVANENCSNMFASFEKISIIDFGNNYDTSNVTDMSFMFYQCSALSTLDLSHFDTSSVTNMNAMFYQCYSLTSLDLTHFDTSNVSDMRFMFSSCSVLTSLNLSHFNTSNVTNMYAMFHFCSALTSLDLSHFDTSSVTDMSAMFWSCSSLTSLDLGHFDTSNVTNMSTMFHHCSALTSLDLSHFDTSNVTDMKGMFCNCSVLTSLDVSKFNTSNVTDMSSMFWYCSGLSSLDLSHFDTSSVTDMSNMFSVCRGLSSLDLSHFDTSSVTDMSSMFWSCSSLSSLDLSHFDMSNVTDMSGMFCKCSVLTSLDVSKFNTSNVTDMSSMFSNCSSLTSLDVSKFNTSNVTDMSSMFSNCSSLTSLDLSSFTFDKLPDVNLMLSFDSVFNNDPATVKVKVTKTGHTYLTETTTNCGLPENSKFVKPDGTDW